VDDSVIVVRVESGLFFANADDVRRRLLKHARVAHDIGQVRDVLRRASDDPSLAHVYPTVDAAVRAAKNDRTGVT
jgi:hypothetical protein